MGIQSVEFFPFARTSTNPALEDFGRGINILSDTDTYAKAPRGQMCYAFHTSFNAWGRFRYCHFKKKICQKGAPVAYSGAAKINLAASVANSQQRAGIAMARASASQYAWVQVEGANFQRVPTDGGIAAGDVCIKDESTAGMLDTVTRSTASTQTGWIMARALAADSGSFMAIGKLIITCE